MVVETTILDGEHCLFHAVRNRRQRDGPPLFALAAERRQQRRVERQPLARAIPELELQHAVRGPRRRPPGRSSRIGRRRTLEHHADDLTLELCAARHDRHRAGTDRKLARSFHRRPLRVSEVVETIDELTLGE